MTASEVGGAAALYETSSAWLGCAIRETTRGGGRLRLLRRGGGERDGQPDQQGSHEEGDASHDASG